MTKNTNKITYFNPLMGTLKPQNNGPLDSNTGDWHIGCW